MVFPQCTIRKIGSGVNSLWDVQSSTRGHRHTPRSEFLVKIYSTIPIQYGFLVISSTQRRTAIFRATATTAFFLLPELRHTARNLSSRTGSLGIARHAHSISHDRTSSELCPVIRPRLTVSPVEYSLLVRPVNDAMCLPVRKRFMSPHSSVSRIAVNHPIPGQLFFARTPTLYRSFSHNARSSAESSFLIPC